MKNLLLVINPRAGKRKICEHLSDVIGLFDRAGYRVECYMTEGQGDATEAVKRFASGKDLVVAAGGDGTLNEVLRGLYLLGEEIPVGYIPAGSTNDFASTLGLSGDIITATTDIIAGFPHSYDIGRFGDRCFSYIASFGAFTKASYSTPQDLKNTLGHLAYILEGIKEISQIHPRHMTLELDGRVISDDFLFVGICNATSIGGLFTLDKERVDLSDGRFEVILVRSPRTLSELSECINAVTQQNLDDSYMVRLYRASKIKVETDPSIPWSLDGEMAEGGESIEIENLQGRLTLIH